MEEAVKCSGVKTGSGEELHSCQCSGGVTVKHSCAVMVAYGLGQYLLPWLPQTRGRIFMTETRV